MTVQKILRFKILATPPHPPIPISPGNTKITHYRIFDIFIVCNDSGNEVISEGASVKVNDP